MLSHWATQKELWIRLIEILEKCSCKYNFYKVRKCLENAEFFLQKKCTIKVLEKVVL